MAEYVRRIMFLKGIIETHKLVSQLNNIYVKVFHTPHDNLFL